MKEALEGEIEFDMTSCTLMLSHIINNKVLPNMAEHLDNEYRKVIEADSGYEHIF